MNAQIDKDLLTKILDHNSTPAYIYNMSTLASTITEIKQAFPISNFQLLFATMANDNQEVLKTIATNDVGACVNSLRHLEIVSSCGFKTSDIQFTSTGLGDEDMMVLREQGITVNFDSISQVQKWFQSFPGAVAGVRINTASLSKSIRNSDRLGICKEDLPKAIELANNTGGRINGLHIYVGTNFTEYQEMIPPLTAFFELAEQVSTLEYVNIGGGIGVDYLGEGKEFDIKMYGKEVQRLVRKLRRRLRRDVKLVLEPGRKLVASCGWFVTRVTDTKMLNNVRYIIVDASVAVFPRPFHHPDTPHRVIVPFKNGELGTEQTTIVGKTTFSKDILAHQILSKNIEPGDVILFDQAGAYCDSMRSRFLGQRDPVNVFLG